MPYSPRPSGSSSISNAGGTVSIDGDGAVHVTPADGQNTNIGGGALAISAPLEDANTAVFKAVDGHAFYTGALGSEVLVATISPDGITGAPISGSTGAFTFATVNSSDSDAQLIVRGDSAHAAMYIQGDASRGGKNLIYSVNRYGIERGFQIYGDHSAFLWNLDLGFSAANTLALRNGANGQTLLLSRSYTDASNYSQLKIGVTGSTVAFSADEAGTGVGTLTGYSFDRGIRFATDNTYDIGASGAMPRDVKVGRQVQVAAGGYLALDGTASSNGVGLTAKTDGVLTLVGYSTVDFDRLQLGGTGPDRPAIKRTGSDIEIVKADGTAVDTAIILSSPNGTRYRVSVSDVGVVTATSL